MAEDNTAEAMDEPEEAAATSQEPPENLAQSAGTGEVAVGDESPEGPANDSVEELAAQATTQTANQSSGAAAIAPRPSDFDGFGEKDLSLILDIPVTLSMEIGQTRITINELLKLGKDSVIELQRMTDEPLDVLVNGTLVAHGEAVVVGDRFGIRLTDVISPQERLKKFT